MVLAILGFAIGVIDANNRAQEPCDDGQDFVCPDGMNWVRLASGERVYWEIVGIGCTKWTRSFFSYLMIRKAFCRLDDCTSSVGRSF
jgi:hypothetical protein